MGAINYNTSDYITLGIKPYDIDDLRNSPDFMDLLKNEYHIDIDNEEAVLAEIYEEINNYYDCDKMNFESTLNKYNFRYFNIELIPGYYEGLSIDIKTNFDFYDYRDKRDAQKEITQLKRFLIEIAGCGFIQVFPGWCTGYRDYKNTIKSISAAIKEIREDVKKETTWSQYNRRKVA